jgi:GT2 family glycosyltransferase
MNKEPVLYIVMRNHNAFELTNTCLKSIYSCSYVNKKIIVVDDGSSDDSGIRLQEEYSELIVLTSDKYIEYCRGLNMGIRYALKNQADFIFVVNNDTDNFSSNYFEVLIDSFKNSPNIGLVGSLVYDYDGNKRSAGTPNTRLGVYVDTPTEGYMFSRKVLTTVGLLDEQLVRYFEDFDYLIRMRNLGFESYFERSVQFDHLGGGTSKKQVFTPNFYRVRNLLWFIKRYGKDKSLKWKLINFKGFMRKHIMLILANFRKGRVIKALAISIVVVLGLIAGLFTKWDNNSYE